MRTFFVEIKCQLGRTYEVASALAEAEIASEIDKSPAKAGSDTTDKAEASTSMP